MSRKRKANSWEPAIATKDSFEARKEREDKLIRAAGWVKPDELEAQANEILQKDHLDLIAEVRKNTELIQQIYSQHQELVKPNNDPDYVKGLQQCKAQRDTIANEVVRVHVVGDPRGTWVGLEMRDKHNYGHVTEVARQVGEHLEAEIIRHGGPQDPA